MALIKKTLENYLKLQTNSMRKVLEAKFYAAYIEIQTKTRANQYNSNSDESIKDLSKKLSDAIVDVLQDKLSTIIANGVDTYIRTAQVNVSPGQVVVSGTTVGATTTPGTGNLS